MRFEAVSEASLNCTFLDFGPMCNDASTDAVLLPDDDGGCSAEPVQPLHIGIPSSFAPTAAAALML